MSTNIIDYIYPLTNSMTSEASSQTVGWKSNTHTPNDMRSETLTLRFNNPTPISTLSFTVKGCAEGLLQIAGITEEDTTIPLSTTMNSTCETITTSKATSYTMRITTTAPLKGLQFTFTPQTINKAYQWELQSLMISSQLSDTHPLDYEGQQTVDQLNNQNTLHVCSYSPQNSKNIYWLSGLTDASTRSIFLTLPLPSYPVSGIKLNPLYEGQQLNAYYNPNSIHQLEWDYTSHHNIHTLENPVELQVGSYKGLVGNVSFSIPPLSQYPLTLRMQVLLTSTNPTSIIQFDGTPYALTVTDTTISFTNTMTGTLLLELEFPEALDVTNYVHLLSITLTVSTEILTLQASSSKLTRTGTLINTVTYNTVTQAIPSANTIIQQNTATLNTVINLPESDGTLYLQLTRPTPIHTLGTVDNETVVNPLTLIGNDNNTIGYNSAEINPFNPNTTSSLITTPTTISFTCPDNNLSYTLTVDVMGSLPTTLNTVFMITDTTSGATFPLQLEATHTHEMDDQYWTEYTTTVRFPENYHGHPLTLTITPSEPLTLSTLHLMNTTAPQSLIPLTGTVLTPSHAFNYQLLTLSTQPYLTALTANLHNTQSLTLSQGVLCALGLTDNNSTQYLTYKSSQSLNKYTTCGIIPNPQTEWASLTLNHTLTTETLSFPYICHGGTLLLEFTQLTPQTLNMDMILQTIQNMDQQTATTNENSTQAATLSDEEKTYYQNPSDLTNPLTTISNSMITHSTIPSIPPHHITQHAETVSKLTSIHTFPHKGENTNYHITSGQTMDHTVLLPGHQQSVPQNDTKMLMNSLTPFTNGKSNHQNIPATTAKRFNLQTVSQHTRNHIAYHTGLINFTWQPTDTLISDTMTLTGSMLTIQTPDTLTYKEKTLEHNQQSGDGIATISLTSLHPFRTLSFTNYGGTHGTTILLPLHETPVLTQTYWQQHPTLNSTWKDSKITWSSPLIMWGTSTPNLPTNMSFISQNITRQPVKALNCTNISNIQLPSLTISHPVQTIVPELLLQLTTTDLNSTDNPLLTLTFTQDETTIQTTMRLNPHKLTPQTLTFPAIGLSTGTWTIQLSSSVPLSFLMYQAAFHTSSLSILMNSQTDSENGMWYNITDSVMNNKSFTLPSPVTTVNLRVLLNNGESFTSTTITPNTDTGYSILPQEDANNFILRITPCPPQTLPINSTVYLQPEAFNLTTHTSTPINPLACMWESTNPNILNVNQYGFISGLANGTATVKAHWLGNVWESSQITVED